jgi:hypothetical protein
MSAVRGVVSIDVRERTDSEKLAYLDGFDAAVKMLTWRLLSVQPHRALAQARAASDLARGSIKLEGE